MIRAFVILVLLIIPSLVIILNILFPDTPGRIIFNLFVFFIMFERIWETFFSTKERQPHKFHGDWTLIAASILYLLMSAIMIIEFFTVHRKYNLFISIVGIVVFVLAALLRFWSIKTLGNQWAVHAVGATKIPKKEIMLLRKGPYKFIRHPIYLGIILELIALPLIPNSYYAFLFALIFNIPMQIIRAFYEEKTSIHKFGEDYLNYKKEVPAFIPINTNQ